MPLNLFGGLISIPFWGYNNLSVAKCDIMLSDLPHVEYRKEKPYTKEQEKILCDLQTDKLDKIKKGGLAASLHMNIDQSKMESAKDAASLVRKIQSKI